ncbi:hypothetical protein AAC387_Pa06g1154 [Persea americana]
MASSQTSLASTDDAILGWTVQIARRLGIFHAAFTTFGGYGAAAYFSLWLRLPHTKTESDTFSVPGLPDTFRLHRSQLGSYLRAADGTDPWSVFMQTQMSISLESDGMICNSVEEMEDTGLQLLRKRNGDSGLVCRTVASSSSIRPI